MYRFTIVTKCGKYSATVSLNSFSLFFFCLWDARCMLAYTLAAVPKGLSGPVHFSSFFPLLAPQLDNFN